MLLRQCFSRVHGQTLLCLISVRSTGLNEEIKYELRFLPPSLTQNIFENVYYLDYAKSVGACIDFNHDNRSRMSGEEDFLRGLYELVSGANKQTIALSTFGRDWSAQSRAFKRFKHHVYHHFKHLVTDNLDWWYRNGFFELSRRAIFNNIRKNTTSVILSIATAFLDRHLAGVLMERGLMPYGMMT